MIFIRARYYREAKEIARRLELSSSEWHYLNVWSLRGTRGATIVSTPRYCWPCNLTLQDVRQIDHDVRISQARVIEVACR